jgi:hypothetical protein
VLVVRAVLTIRLKVTPRMFGDRRRPFPGLLRVHGKQGTKAPACKAEPQIGVELKFGILKSIDLTIDQRIRACS